MSRLFFVSTLFVCIVLTSAAVFEGIYKDPDHPDKCVMKELNLILSPGDEVPHPKACSLLKCYADSVVRGYSCGVIGIAEGCVLAEPEDPTAIYPNCCKITLCNGIEK